MTEPEVIKAKIEGVKKYLETLREGLEYHESKCVQTNKAIDAALETIKFLKVRLDGRLPR